MKPLRTLLALGLILCLLSGCGAAPASDPTTQPAAVLTGVLYADFSCGSTYSDDSFIREYPFEYTGRQKTAEELASELTALTGLDFVITAQPCADGWIVDWAPESTLLAGPDNREQKEDFFFQDINSLSLFMLDSLWLTLKENLEAENIYYTMDGGRELIIADLVPLSRFPSDLPYLGSVFYAAHTDTRGPEEDGLYLYGRTAGLWRLDGAADSPSIEMDGMGGFTMYDAGGNVEHTGYLDCVDEFGDGTFRYDMYTAEGSWICGFYFDSDTRFHMGNDGKALYLLEGREDSNLYVDAAGGFQLIYPTVFSSTGTQMDNGVVDFHTLWDAGMRYWTDPNDLGLTPEQFRSPLQLTESMVLDGNVVIGYGEAEDLSGERVPAAWYWLVNRDVVANVMILCSEADEAPYWYSQFQTGAFRIEPAAPSQIPVLIWPGRFSGMEPLETSSSFSGGYLYRDLTEDTLTVVTNCCMLTDQAEGEPLESYLSRVILAAGSWEPRDLTWTEAPEHSARLRYPVYLLNWETGGNEDSRGCNGFFFMTDTHTYLFSFDTAMDFQEEMLSTWDAVLDTLILE